jgi:hypothetical protein
LKKTGNIKTKPDNEYKQKSKQEITYPPEHHQVGITYNLYYDFFIRAIIAQGYDKIEKHGQEACHLVPGVEVLISAIGIKIIAP